MSQRDGLRMSENQAVFGIPMVLFKVPSSSYTMKEPKTLF